MMNIKSLLTLSLAALFLSTNLATAQTPEPEGERPAPRRRAVKKENTMPTAPIAATKPDNKIDTDELFKSLDYPELQVVPRASERLHMEAQYEAEKKYLVHWPIALPSLANLYLGLSSRGEYKARDSNDRRDEADLYADSATIVGGFWLATTAFISWSRPYRAGLARARKNRDSDKKGELFRERIAEEALEQQAKTMRTLVYLSVITNLLATSAVAGSHDISDSQVAITGLLAFAPFIFEHRYISTWDKHLEYKRKIYTPISSLHFRPDESSQKLFPQLSLRWDF